MPKSRTRSTTKKKKARKSVVPPKTVSYVCLQCKVREEIPQEVVRYMDAMDDGDPTVPPRFSCEACGGEMWPISYKGVHGEIYKQE